MRPGESPAILFFILVHSKYQLCLGTVCLTKFEALVKSGRTIMNYCTSGLSASKEESTILSECLFNVFKNRNIVIKTPIVTACDENDSAFKRLHLPARHARHDGFFSCGPCGKSTIDNSRRSGIMQKRGWRLLWVVSPCLPK